MTKYQIISKDGTLISETLYLSAAKAMQEHHIGSRIVTLGVRG